MAELAPIPQNDDGWDIPKEGFPERTFDIGIFDPTLSGQINAETKRRDIDLADFLGGALGIALKSLRSTPDNYLALRVSAGFDKVLNLADPEYYLRGKADTDLRAVRTITVESKVGNDFMEKAGPLNMQIDEFFERFIRMGLEVSQATREKTMQLIEYKKGKREEAEFFPSKQEIEEKKNKPDASTDSQVSTPIFLVPDKLPQFEEKGRNFPVKLYDAALLEDMNREIEERKLSMRKFLHSCLDVGDTLYGLNPHEQLVLRSSVGFETPLDYMSPDYSVFGKMSTDTTSTHALGVDSDQGNSLMEQCNKFGMSTISEALERNIRMGLVVSEAERTGGTVVYSDGTIEEPLTFFPKIRQSKT